MILLKIFLSLVIYWAMFNVIAPFAPASFGPLLLTGLAALLSLPLLYVFYRRERGRHGQEARPEYRRLGPSLALILLFGAAASPVMRKTWPRPSTRRPFSSSWSAPAC